MGRLTKRAQNLFESLKHSDENGQEYWTARDLSKALEYSEYRKFLPAARKAWTACHNSGYNPADHFVPFGEMVSIGYTALSFNLMIGFVSGAAERRSCPKPHTIEPRSGD